MQAKSRWRHPKFRAKSHPRLRLSNGLSTIKSTDSSRLLAEFLSPRAASTDGKKCVPSVPVSSESPTTVMASYWIKPIGVKPITASTSQSCCTRVHDFGHEQGRSLPEQVTWCGAAEEALRAEGHQMVAVDRLEVLRSRLQPALGELVLRVGDETAASEVEHDTAEEGCEKQSDVRIHILIRTNQTQNSHGRSVQSGRRVSRGRRDGCSTPGGCCRTSHPGIAVRCTGTTP